MEPLTELLGDSPGILALRDQVRQLMRAWSAARRPPPVVILGETGTGKGLLARAMHRASPRAQAPFVDINCAAVPETLLEAELFGFERGAFTDARQAKAGLFQIAHRGALFLDEIGLLPPSLQAKLLSALEDRAVRRLGGTRAEPADVWVLAATNQDLRGAVRARTFRDDLYHRLSVLTLTLPPLRERGGDLLLLAEHFLARSCAAYHLPAKSLGREARAALCAYSWPGNVRELGNVIERASLLTDASVLGAAHLSLPAEPSIRATAAAAAAGRASPPESASDVMREHLLATLERTGWNISRTAEILGVSRNTVRARIARFRLQPARGATGGRRAAMRAPGAGAESLASPRPAAVGGPWRARLLALLVVRLSEPADGEMSAQRTLAVIADRIHGFAGRVETLGPAGLGAVFGLGPADEPAVLAAHGAMVIRNALRRGGRRAARPPAITMGLHTAEILVNQDPAALALDADGSRRAWNALDALLAGAEPDATVVTEAAAALLRRRFVLVPLDDGTGGYRIDGFWRAGPIAGRDAGRLAGRREELALLESRLAVAARGLGQVIDVVGEAGIGKSRLLLGLTESAVARTATYLEGRCSSATVSTPFAPVLSILHDACGTTDADSPEAVRDKVAAAAREAGVEDPDVVRALVDLLTTEAGPRAEADPGQIKQRLFRAVRRLLVGRSHAAAPLLIAVEDLHWVDPTSEECLASLVEAMSAAPILVITTARPGHRAPWAAGVNVTQLPLAPLSREHSLDVIQGVVGAATMPERTVEQILARGEGNPLFLEELSRAVLEGTEGRPTAGVPTTIEEVIRVRVERLRPRPREVLGRAAVIGREMPVSLLRVMSQLSEAALEESVEALRRADFLYETSIRGAERTVAFKHAIVQEVAHDRLPAPERRALHARAVDAIEELYADRLTDHVERLAHHAVLSGDGPRALRYLLQAGQKAAARSALAEAAEHLAKGLDLIRLRPEGAERDRNELAFQMATGVVLRARRGSAAPETGRVLARARELCERLGDFDRLGPVLVGQWFAELVRARYGAARALARELEGLAERDRDPLLGALAARAVGMTALHEGAAAEAREYLERGRAVVYREADQARVLTDYGGDPRASCLAYLGRALWSLGYPDQALARSREAVAYADSRGATLDVAAALTMLTSVHQLRRDMRETREATEQALAYARQRGVSYWLARNALLLSWEQAIQARGAEREAGVAAMRRSFEVYRATGTMLGLSWFLALLAQAAAAAGQIQEGLGALDLALTHIDETGERYHEAEIHCLRGELLLMNGGPASAEEAEACFRRGLDVARGQQAKGWELRVATRLAAFLHKQRRDDEARELLAPVYRWFTEGFDTADLVEARDLLGELSAAT